MILKESELNDQDVIRPLLGKPYREPGKLLTATGSTIYFVKEITNLEGNPLPLKREEMKAIFQRYEKGLMLFFTSSNYQNGIPVSYDSIEKVQLSKNIEERDFSDTLFHNFLNLISRISFLKFIHDAYKFRIHETLLVFETDFFNAKMITSYSSFNSQATYFTNLGLKDKVDIIK